MTSIEKPIKQASKDTEGSVEDWKMEDLSKQKPIRTIEQYLLKTNDETNGEAVPCRQSK